MAGAGAGAALRLEDLPRPALVRVGAALGARDLAALARASRGLRGAALDPLVWEARLAAGWWRGAGAWLPRGELCALAVRAWADWEQRRGEGGPHAPRRGGGGARGAGWASYPPPGGVPGGWEIPACCRVARRLAHMDALTGLWEERSPDQPAKGSLVFFGWDDVGDFCAVQIKGGPQALLCERLALEGPAGRAGGGAKPGGGAVPGFSTEPLPLSAGSSSEGGGMDGGGPPAEDGGYRRGEGLVLIVEGRSRAQVPAPSEQERAVAATAGAGAEMGELGASPPGSFQHEMLQFTQGRVKSKKGRRRSPDKSIPIRRLPSPRELAAGGAPPHPLVGYWVGNYGPRHGYDVLKLEVEPLATGGPRMLVATKILGDLWVPAGSVTWQVQLEPLATPWPSEEAELVLHHRDIVMANCAMEDDVRRDAGAPGPRGAAGLEAKELWGHPSRVPQEEELLKETVVAVRPGQVHIALAPGGALRWFRGRLWEYNTGRISFVTDPLFGMLPNYYSISVNINFDRLDLGRTLAREG